MTANIIDKTYEVLASPCLRSCTPSMVSSFIRVVCAVNLQRISDLLKCCWAFSLALDSAAHQNTAYLDVRIRVYVTRLRSIVNLHVCALPFHDLHTGEAMFRMVVKLFDVLCAEWRSKLLAVSSDGARNMTGRLAEVVSRLAKAIMLGSGFSWG
jgi:hypothetical protein